jgi:hypothetical protein
MMNLVTIPLDMNPCDLKTAHVRLSIIVESDLSAEAIEAELRSWLDSVPGFHGAVVTLTHTESL